ncbi:MAG: SGNH/GDSL hydrolase family protein [Rubripirellula sp.]
MIQIVVYGDSLSWGIVPGTRMRLNFADRWPGVMEGELLGRRRDVRVIEDCLNGRRTILDDPNKAGRNGLQGLEQRIEAHSPLSLVILFLGTNDFQITHQFHARDSAQGVAMLVTAIRQAPIEPGMSVPEILLIAPPTIRDANGDVASKFAGAPAKAIGLAEEFRLVADQMACDYFDAGTVVTTSPIDGVHLDASQHRVLGIAIAAQVGRILDRDN